MATFTLFSIKEMPRPIKKGPQRKTERGKTPGKGLPCG